MNPSSSASCSAKAINQLTNSSNDDSLENNQHGSGTDIDIDGWVMSADANRETIILGSKINTSVMKSHDRLCKAATPDADTTTSNTTSTLISAETISEPSIKSTREVATEPSSIYKKKIKSFGVSKQHHPVMITSKPGAVNVGPTVEADTYPELTYKRQIIGLGVSGSTRRHIDNISSTNSIKNNNNNNNNHEDEPQIVVIPSKPGAINVGPDSVRREIHNNRSNDNMTIPIVDEPHTESFATNNTMKDGSEIILNENEDIINIPLAAEVYEEKIVPLAHASVLRQFSFKKKFLICIGISLLIIATIATTTFLTAKNATSSISYFDESTTPSPTNTDSPSLSPTAAHHIGTDTALFSAVDKFLSGGETQSQVVNVYGNIQNWDVSGIQNFSSLFSSVRNPFAANFNEDISRWDVSDATNLEWMFYGATKFDTNLGLWNVSNVINMEALFFNAISFRGNGLDRWQTSKVSNMFLMFQDAVSFDANLSGWDVRSLVNMDSTFCNASLYRGIGIEEWNTSRVESMNALFKDATKFNANLSKWDVSNVKNMGLMFDGALDFEGIGIDHWNTSNVEDMYRMFLKTSSFDANLARWDVSKVIWMTQMFEESSFKGMGVNLWNTSNVQFMKWMFFQASNFDANLSMWDTSNVISGIGQFVDTTSFHGIGLENWNTSQMITMNSMFKGASSFDANLSQWDVSNVEEMFMMFDGAKSFRGTGLETWDVSNVNDTACMFCNAISFDANLTEWDTSNIEDKRCMFSNATTFRGVPWINEEKCKSKPKSLY